MKPFGNKIDGNPGAAGIVNASDYNSVFKELDNAVAPFITPRAGENHQLAKSIDIAIKHQSYETAGGSANDIILVRAGYSAVKIETEVDRMQIPFKCTAANTGAMSAKIGDLIAKPVLFNGQPVVPGWLVVGAYYSLTYIESTGHYNIDSISGDLLYERKGYIRDTFYTKSYLDDKFRDVIRTAKFTQGKAGWLKLSNGFITQWDEVIVEGDSSSTPLLFPVTFPNAVINVQLTLNIPPPGRHNNDSLLGVSYVTKRGYSVYNGYGRGNKPSSIFVAAMGY